MTPYQILLIRQSFARLEFKGEKLGVAVYEHLFKLDRPEAQPVKFIRLNIFPDGGISRLRVVGTRAG